jgi:signal transduction histidine kinase
MYVKILLSFLAVLLVTEILVFYLFIIIPVRHFNTRFNEFAEQRTMALKEVVEEKVRSAPGVPWSQNDPLKGFVRDFARLLGARIWLTDKDGNVVLASFPGRVPDLGGPFAKARTNRYRSFTLHGHKDFDFYATVPLASSGGWEGEMHILFDRQGFSPRKGHFALGLAVIGFLIALSIIPISRLITRRIKLLRESAIIIAEGDLSHRVTIEGRDEISELARAFNGMTDKLEGMIVSGKDLIANVSHELRSPLTRIRIAEEMLRDKVAQGGSDDIARHLDAIREDVGELDALIGRILELSRLDMYEAPYQPEPLDPSELMKELIEKLRPALDRKELQVSTELSYEPPFTADREALGTALMNVLDNAVKFTRERGAISVRMGWHPDSLEIRVVNTFEALPEEDLARIFDPFHRATRAQASGSGLGLAITSKAVQKHGGSVEARNTDVGLEIGISLPRQARTRLKTEQTRTQASGY